MRRFLSNYFDLLFTVSERLHHLLFLLYYNNNNKCLRTCKYRRYNICNFLCYVHGSQSRYGYSQPRSVSLYISGLDPPCQQPWWRSGVELCHEGSGQWFKFYSRHIFSFFFFSFYCLVFIVVCDLFSLTLILIIISRIHYI